VRRNPARPHTQGYHPMKRTHIFFFIAAFLLATAAWAPRASAAFIYSQPLSGGDNCTSHPAAGVCLGDDPIYTLVFTATTTVDSSWQVQLTSIGADSSCGGDKQTYVDLAATIDTDHIRVPYAATTTSLYTFQGSHTFLPGSYGMHVYGEFIGCFYPQVRAITDGTGYTSIPPALFTGYITNGGGATPYYSDFTVNSASSTVHAAGYALAGDKITFTESSLTLGQMTAQSFTASSSGFFSHDFAFFPSGYAINSATSSFYLASGMTLSSQILAPAFFDPTSGTTGSAILAATSTKATPSTASTTIDISELANLPNLPDQPCGIDAIGGCVKNAFVWLFYPSESVLNALSSLTFRGKFPFEYAYQIGDVRTALLSASSTASTSVTVKLWKLPYQATTTNITLLSRDLVAAVPFSGLIQGILAALLWFFTAEYVYHRIIKVHDSNTPNT